MPRLLIHVLVVLGAAGAGAASLSACGSGLSPKQQYIQQADAICKLGVVGRRAVGPPPLTEGSQQSQLKALGPYLDAIVGEYDAELERLQALVRPSQDLDVLTRYLSRLALDVTRLEQFDALVHRGDTAAIHSRAATLASAISGSEADVLARQYGMKTCAGSGP
jgi:hypothetical protein